MDLPSLLRIIAFQFAILSFTASSENYAKSVAGSLSLQKPNYHDDDDLNQCTPIREPVCQGLQYTDTKMPNWVKMNSQEEAAKRMIDYRSLLNINCSHYLKLFLCTIYFPMCTPVLEKSSLKPCKPLCIHVQNRCEPIMQRFQFNWPAELSCDDLPESPALCIEPDGYILDSNRAILPDFPTGEEGLDTSSPNIESLQRMYPQLEEIFKQRNQGSRNLNALFQAAVAATNKGLSTGTDNTGVSAQKSCLAAEFSVKNFLNGSCLTYCGADLYYHTSDKIFARKWLLVWSCLCIVSSVLTFVTFFSDNSRFQYPERPVIYLSACYFAVAIGNLLQYSLGAERVTCRSLPMSEHDLPDSGKYLLKSGQDGTWCTVGFLVVYYFGMASNFWWVMLSLAWYLSTSRKWGHEGVESVSSVFHMFAWALPAIQSILILILHKIDADELTGSCFSGNHNENALLFGVLLPQALCLFLGLILLSIGFSAVFRVHRKLKIPSIPGAMEVDSRRRLEKSIVKLGVFAVLYTIPVLCLLAGNIYDYLGQPRWRLALESLHRSKPNCLSQRGVAWGIKECHPTSSPSSEAAMLRIFMSIVVGITSGMWVWANKKTIRSWRSGMSRCWRRPSHGTYKSDAVDDGHHGRPAKISELPNRRQPPTGSQIADNILGTAEQGRLRTCIESSAVNHPSHSCQGIFNAEASQTAYSTPSAYPLTGCQSCLERDTHCSSSISPLHSTTQGYNSSQSVELFGTSMEGLHDSYLHATARLPDRTFNPFPSTYQFQCGNQAKINSSGHSIHNSNASVPQFNRSLPSNQNCI